MVAYRDRSDQNCMEKIGFTENLDEFQTFIRSLKYTGGDDECEDVQIGLKEVINLQWKQNALNLLIWIADSPCHGKQFHEDSVNDNYPQDDGEGLKKLLKDSFASQCLQESDISNTDEIEYNDDIKQNYWLRSIQGDIFSFR
ncbi:hypothetical protein ABPG74_013569 [Tetrahymena malaccensis]